MVTGQIAMFGSVPASPSWLPCNGAAVSRATYAALFTAIGTTFGAGDGSSTFNVPNLNGRSPMGTGTADSGINRVLGTNDGANTHQLTDDEIPSHSHDYNQPDIQQQVAAGDDYPAFTFTSGSQTGSNGGDQAHSIVHPVAVVIFAIFAGA